MRWADELPSLSGIFAVFAIAFAAEGISSLLKRSRSPWRPKGDTLAMLLIAALMLGLVTAAALAETVDRKAIHVIDGDTIKIGDAPWRLTGFDAPEAGRGKCKAEVAKGIEATFRMHALLDAAKSIEIIPQGTSTDRYGRRLGRLLVDGRDVGTLLIGERLAQAWNGRGKRPDWCLTASA